MPGTRGRMTMPIVCARGREIKGGESEQLRVRAREAAHTPDKKLKNFQIENRIYLLALSRAVTDIGQRMSGVGGRADLIFGRLEVSL